MTHEQIKQLAEDVLQLHRPDAETVVGRCCHCGKSIGNITFSVCDDCWTASMSGLPLASEMEKPRTKA